MPPRKSTKPQAENTPKAPDHVTSIDGDTATIHPVDVKDLPRIAGLLIAKADQENPVRTVTSPLGFATTAKLAKATGLD